MSYQAAYYDFSKEQLWQIRLLTHIACGFSLAGTLFVIASHLLFPRLRSNAFEFVVMLGFSDLMSNLAYLIKPDEHISAEWCTTQAFFLTFSWCASSMWYFWIAFTIHKIFLQAWSDIEKCRHLMQRYRCRAHLTTWFIALFLALLPLTTATTDNPNGMYEPSRKWNVDNPAPLWCFIKSTDATSMAFRVFFLDSAGNTTCISCMGIL